MILKKFIDLELDLDLDLDLDLNLDLGAVEYIFFL
jgi:hypothetical protein